VTRFSNFRLAEISSQVWSARLNWCWVTLILSLHLFNSSWINWEIVNNVKLGKIVKRLFYLLPAYKLLRFKTSRMLADCIKHFLWCEIKTFVCGNLFWVLKTNRSSRLVIVKLKLSIFILFIYNKIRNEQEHCKLYM